MSKVKLTYLLLLIVPLLLLVWFFYTKNQNKPLRSLPFYGSKHALKINDTTYHIIPPFLFVNQYNQKITEADVKGKVYVTDYFFTTCQSICPVMSTSLERVYKEFNNREDFMILSHTVDPETDSVAQLLSYAKLHGVKDNKWMFVTGEKKHLYEVARKGYLLNAEEGDGGAEDFIHTQNFALIDKERHIRGFYDGTDSTDVNNLITDIKLLLKEYDYKAKN